MNIKQGENGESKYKQLYPLIHFKEYNLKTDNTLARDID